MLIIGYNLKIVIIYFYLVLCLGSSERNNLLVIFLGSSEVIFIGSELESELIKGQNYQSCEFCRTVRAEFILGNFLRSSEVNLKVEDELETNLYHC